jgi:hypothetical protein
MNNAIKEHITEYWKSKGWGEPTEQDMIDEITDSFSVWDGDYSGSRHWTSFFRVVDVNGMLIGFDWASSDGDMTATEKGWEFDPDSICQVEKVAVQSFVYKPLP